MSNNGSDYSDKIQDEQSTKKCSRENHFRVDFGESHSNFTLAE